MIDPQCLAKLIKAVIACRLRLSFGEAVREFCPVVGQDMRDGKRKKGMALVQEIVGVVCGFIGIDLVVHQSSSPVYGDKQIVLHTVDLRQVGHIHMQKARSVLFELFRFGFFLLRYAADAKRTQCSGYGGAFGRRDNALYRIDQIIQWHPCSGPYDSDKLFFEIVQGIMNRVGSGTPITCPGAISPLADRLGTDTISFRQITTA